MSTKLDTLSSKTDDGPTPSESSESSLQEIVYPSMSPLREVLYIFILIFAQLITQAAVAQGLLPLNNVGATFGINSVQTLVWGVAGYSLSVGTFILAAGRLGDIYGHKLLYILGFVWFIIWTFLAGISHFSNFIFYATARGLQGIGPAILLPNAMALIGRSYPPGIKQTMLFALFGATAPGGFVLGACFTSLAVQRLTWEWTYYICALISALVCILALIVVPQDEARSERANDESFDYVGALLGICGLVLFNVAWNQAPTVGWSTPYTYILLIIGFVLLCAFVFAETKVKHPLVPFKIFNRKIVLALACIACGWGTFGIWVFYFFVMLKDLRQQTALMVTAQLTPAAVCGFLASGLTGFLLSKRVPVSVVMFGAMSAFMTVAMLLATMPVSQTYWSQAFVCAIIGPFGMDMSFPAATIMFSTSVPRHHQGMAASVVTTVVNYSISIALGFAGTMIAYTTPGATVDQVTSSVHHSAYMGVGLSGLGMCFAALSIILEIYERKYGRKAEQGDEKA